MPVLKNPRHERFCQLLAGGKTAKDAYALAGYKPSESNGAWLARKEEISTRVAEINHEAFARERKAATVAAERSVVTRQSLIEMAKDVYVQAKQSGQMSAATMALKELGVLSGIRIERSERGSPGQFDWLEKLSVDELRQLAAGELDIAQYQPSAERPSVN
jgi:phage terminase small subunit